ncbi:hypothetical protein [Ereboglobus luteus]|uniref:DUF1795 domain-containing protein n=1 Tax=Ereboglobus luteus TaxID=1796921 RepID=A0A2U8E4C5_9BACT|nr:hypothetical protein [Ereboglobus luteus]AWI09769.1 hypothetical protein CKA38_11375 [Ereboglobus luteus]
MKKTIIVLLTQLVLGLACADTIQLETGSFVTITLPSGWSANLNTSRSNEKVYWINLISPEKNENAGKIALDRLKHGWAATEEKFIEHMSASIERLSASLKEQPVSLNELKTDNAIILYQVLVWEKIVSMITGAGLAEYKGVGVIHIRYNSGHTAMITVPIKTLDNSNELNEILNIAQNMQISMPLSENKEEESAQSSIQITQNEHGTVIGNPDISRVSLLLPSKNYKATPGALAIGRGDPGYFIGRDMVANVIMSGWFSPIYKFKYKTARDLWKKDTPKQAKNLEYLKIKEWDVMVHELEIPIKTQNTLQVTLRANLLEDGTWIDLRLSSMGIASQRADMRKALIDYINTLQVNVAEARGFHLKYTKQGVIINAPAETPGSLFIKTKSLLLQKRKTHIKTEFFLFQDSGEDIKVIAWLRPASDYHYANVKTLWDETRATLSGEGFTVIGDTDCQKTRNWDVMLYDLKTGDKRTRNVNMRASCVSGGIWVDVHFTTVDQRDSSFLRSKLLAYLKNFKVSDSHVE